MQAYFVVSLLSCPSRGTAYHDAHRVQAAWVMLIQYSAGLCAGAYGDGATPIQSPSSDGGMLMVEDCSSSWSAAGTPSGHSMSSNTSNWAR